MTHVLMDAEIGAKWDAIKVPFAPRIGDSDAHGLLAFARAVEAATLAKVRDTEVIKEQCKNAADGLLSHCVLEREARTRERAAWDACAKHELGRSYASCGEYNRRARDMVYPLPTVRRPRTVTLSDGMTVSRKLNATDNTPWLLCWEAKSPDHGLRTGETANPYAYARTPADARVLADLVESPYEDVPA